jgi:hypothetical protein
MSQTLTQVIVQQSSGKKEVESHDDYLRRGLLKTSQEHFLNDRYRSHSKRKYLYHVSAFSCCILFILLLIFVIKAIQG